MYVCFLLDQPGGDLIPMSLLNTYKFPSHETNPLKQKKYVGRLHDQLGGRLYPHVPVQNTHLMRLSL
jgi:hypothetical protein